MITKSNKILVTGADGFIGSHLTELLLEMGYQVRALSYYNSFNFWGWLEDIPANPNLEVVSGDVRDAYFTKHIMQDVDIVFHLAALIAIPYSYIAPDAYVDTNIKGTLNICQAAKENKVKRVLITSTSEVYGTAKYVPIDEKHPKQPQSPYAATKIGADALALSFYHAFDLPVTIVRPFNTYGPRQSARAVIPTIIAQIASGVSEIKIGNLAPTRDFNYVKDTCFGFMQLASCNQAIGEEVNISCNYEISIREVLNLIAELMDANILILEDRQRVRPLNSEVHRLWGDNGKIKTLTAFQPRYDIRTGLRETIKWFTKPENLAKYKSAIYNV